MRTGRSSGLQPVQSDISCLNENQYASLRQNIQQLSRAGFARTFFPPECGLEDSLFGFIAAAGGFRQSEFQDQNIRGQEIANEIVRSRPTRLIRLDGHGRMLASVLHHLLQLEYEDLETINISIVDICPTVNEFHQLFLPRSIDPVEIDVLRVDVAATDLVYLNF